MRLKEFISKKPIVIVTAILLITTTLLLSSIFIITIKENQTSNDVGILTGYADLKQKIITVASEDLDESNTSYSRMLNQMVILEDESKSEKEKYDALSFTVFFLKSEYSRSNNPKYYPLIKEVDVFAKSTFPDLYDESIFYTSCQDKSCADTPQPQELNEILRDIEKSDLPDEVKETLNEDLINTGYKSDENELEGKVGQYLMLANMVRDLNELSESGTNKIIAEKIYNLVNNNYPDDYKRIEQTITEIFE